jgi:hypothetical protein
MSGTADPWSATVADWAAAQADIRALVQIGSRVQPGAKPDAWSDYDYQLITTHPGRYRDGAFARALGPCWAVGAEGAFGNVTKVTAVYAGAREADFVILSHLEVRIATLALRFPGTAGLWPGPLRRGVGSLRRVAGEGWRVIKGGAAWERRYARIRPIRFRLTEREFAALCGHFWTQVVWAAKKAERGEWIASQRALHVGLMEDALRLYEEEALLGGGPAHPLGRRAETWLSPEQARARSIGTAPERQALLAALGRLAAAFAASSAAVAAGQGWPDSDAAAVRTWLAGLAGGPPVSPT